MAYASLYLLPVPKARLDDYRTIADKWNEIFLDLGGLDHREWVMETPVVHEGLPAIPSNASDDEVMVFSVVECSDKTEHDRIMKEMEQDPRMKPLMDETLLDMKKMQVSGFSHLAGRRMATSTSEL